MRGHTEHQVALLHRITPNKLVCVFVFGAMACVAACDNTPTTEPHGDIVKAPEESAAPVAPAPAPAHGAYVPNTWKVTRRDDGDVVTMHGCTEWDILQLQHLDRFVRVECSMLRGEVDFGVLRTLQRCESVSVSLWSGADSKSFATLCALPWLKHLEIEAVHLPPEAFEALRAQDHIESLTIRSHILGFQALCEVVSRCTSLRRLTLGSHLFHANDLLVFTGASITEMYLEAGIYRTTDAELADLARKLQPIILTWP